MSKYYQAEKLLEIIEEASGATDLFDNRDGILSTTVHTGRTIEAFYLKIEFPRNSVLITTNSFLGVEERNYNRINIMLKSINSLLKNGSFFIDEHNILSFSTRCKFRDFLSVENPFDIIFSGSETFEKFTESILKALSGTNVFFGKF